MRKTAIISLVLLGVLWAWLAWGVLSAGVTLYNLLIVGMGGIIIFVPMFRKYQKEKEKNENK